MEFLNPWYMVWGGALVSSPIIIHLINRMRFKRIRWAAMEFLLKSQKRNRRRLIIEQLILLLLRILLVLLAGFLVARLVNKAAGKPEEGATHVIVLDDSLSLADHGFEKNGDRTGFATAKDRVMELAKTLNRASSPQHIQVKLLSELDQDLFPMQKVSDKSLTDLDKALQGARTTYLRLTPKAAFETGLTELLKVSKGQRVFHFASDFRDHDWSEPVQKQVEEMVKHNILVSLIDVAGPYRNKDQKVVQSHDNFAILDVSCETSVVPVGVDATFTVTIKNFGLAKVEPFLTVKVDGVEDYRGIGPVGAIQGGETINKRFQLSFGKKKPPVKISARDSLEERERKRRQDREYFRISVQLNREPGETGIRPDNARDMVIEVRQEIPLLIVEGRPSESQEEGSDVAHLESALVSARKYFKVGDAFAVQRCKIQDLDRVDLSLYPTVFFLNVAEIKSHKTLDRLDDYVRNDGGCIVYFMGDNAQPDFYNKTLYGEYGKLFPVLLDRVTSLIDPSGTLTPEQRELKREEMLQKDQPRILFRDGAHPVVKTLYADRGILGQLDVDRYYRTQPRGRWTEEGSSVEEIVTMPNIRDKVDAGYGTTGVSLGSKALAEAEKLVKTDPEFKHHVAYLTRYQRDIATAASAEGNFELVSVFDALLNDQGIKGNDNRPDMTTLWAHPQMKGIQQQIKAFIETVSYGDPLVVARRHGAPGRGGRVVTVLTTAGTASRWNRWGDGCLASYTFVPFVIDLERWLLSGSPQNNRPVARPRYQLTSESLDFLKSEQVPDTVLDKLKDPKNEVFKKVFDRESLTKALGKVLDKDEQGRYQSLILIHALTRPFRLELDTGRYQQKLQWTFQPQDDMDQLDEHKKPRRQRPSDPVKVTMQRKQNSWFFALPEQKRPGVLTLELTPVGVAGEQVAPELRAYAFNVDTRESEMGRANRDTLLKAAGGKLDAKAPVVVRSPEDGFETYKEKEPDISDSAWLYLLFLLILVAEQAMAVHLSFPSKGQ